MNFGKCWRTISTISDGSKAGSFLVELRTRSLLWLLLEEDPVVSFESVELRETIEMKRPHELRTARRLVRNGVRARFVRDTRNIIDLKTNEVKKVGMADLANGYELKTLESAATFSSIDGYLRRAAKKRNVKAVVFDNTDNRGMNDDTLGEYIEKARRRFKGRVYILAQDEGYRRKI